MSLILREGRADNQAMRSFGRHRLAVMLASGPLLACSPTLDWRDVHPEGSALMVQLPCRPSKVERPVHLAGAQVRLTLYACSAGGQTWGLGVADVTDPARLAPALDEWRGDMAANIQAATVATIPLHLAGTSPGVTASRIHLVGQRPDGRRVQMQLALFAQGTRVYQATVLGETVPDDAAETFFDSLRWPR